MRNLTESRMILWKLLAPEPVKQPDQELVSEPVKLEQGSKCTGEVKNADQGWTKVLETLVCMVRNPNISVLLGEAGTTCSLKAF